MKVTFKILVMPKVTGKACTQHNTKKNWLDMDLTLNMQQNLSLKTTLNSNSEKGNTTGCVPVLCGINLFGPVVAVGKEKYTFSIFFLIIIPTITVFEYKSK